MTSENNFPKVSEQERLENIAAHKEAGKVDKIFSRIIKDAVKQKTSILPNIWFEHRFMNCSDKSILLAWSSKNAGNAFSYANRNVPDYRTKQQEALLISKSIEGMYFCSKDRNGKRFIVRGDLLSHIKSHFECEIETKLSEIEAFRKQPWYVKGFSYFMRSAVYLSFIGGIVFMLVLILAPFGKGVAQLISKIFGG